MLLSWLDAHEASEVGISLADHFASQTDPKSQVRGTRAREQKVLEDFFHRAEREVRELRLNFYRKAKLANSFKWRLLEKGVDGAIAAEVTRNLVTHLSLSRAAVVPDTQEPGTRPSNGGGQSSDLLRAAGESMQKGVYQDAINRYQDYLELNPRDAVVHNNLGAAFGRLSRFQEAEQHFRRAISIKPNYTDAHCNLGGALREMGQLAPAEGSLRRALKLNKNHLDARLNLGLTLLAGGSPAEAKSHLERALRAAPKNVVSILGLGEVAITEGKFDAAETLFKRALEVNENEPAAWAALAGVRKMTSADSAWLKRAEEIASGNITPREEATLRFAIGKCCDDLGDYTRAFKNYRRANDVMRTITKGYNRESHTRFVNDLIQVYSRERLRQVVGSSDSKKPVLVVGMPRSGTSLVEQIIAAHPSAAGAGELHFWTEVVSKHEPAFRAGLLEERQRRMFAEGYLRLLDRHSTEATRVVDKAPINSDYLGLIASVFPGARIIYMRRDPIDTCLSCYFQQFASAISYKHDLSDLAYYYREHRRLMTHWRAVLPADALLEVPYAELVTNQEEWSRRILSFIGLEWDERCLNFHNTQRTVATASAWQVRQKLYASSVGRWRNYEKFIGPLRELQHLKD